MPKCLPCPRLLLSFLRLGELTCRFTQPFQAKRKGKERERGGDFKIFMALMGGRERERGNKFPSEEMLLPLPRGLALQF